MNSINIEELIKFLISKQSETKTINILRSEERRVGKECL